MMLILIGLQLFLLLLAIFWTEKRKIEVPLKRALQVAKNGLPKGAFLTPAKGHTVFHDHHTS